MVALIQMLEFMQFQRMGENQTMASIRI